MNTSLGRLPTATALLLVGAALPSLSHAQTNAPAKAWQTSVSVTVKEAYDSNVYMQSTTARANQSALVSSFVPSFGATWKPSEAFNLTASYTPEVTLYHGASSENNVAQKGVANFTGKLGNVKYEFNNALTYVIGDHLSPTYTGVGGSAIIGGFPLLERRDQFLVRQSAKAQIPFGKWFVRPLLNTYFHDFQTEHRTTAGYQNYVDRNDVGGGLDLGRSVTDKLAVFVGYRYGKQDQGQSPVSALQYDNTYHRPVVGLEGALTSWMKLSVQGGPDIREFTGTVPATFDQNAVRFYLDGSLTLTPGKFDTVAFTARRFVLPAYGGGGFFEISAYDVAWKHKFNDKVTGGLTGRMHNWDFAAPLVRSEWWYGASASISYAPAKHWTLDAGYELAMVKSDVPNTPGREATRHLLSLAARYSF